MPTQKRDNGTLNVGREILYLNFTKVKGKNCQPKIATNRQHGVQTIARFDKTLKRINFEQANE